MDRHREDQPISKSRSSDEQEIFFRYLKLLPVAGLYIGQVAFVYKSVGLLPAAIAFSWLVFLAIGWPKKLIAQGGLAIILGVLVPFFALPALQV